MKVVSIVQAVVLAIAVPWIATVTRLQQLTIDDVMSAEEQSETGVAELDVYQRDALDQWLNRYTRRVREEALAASSTPPPAPAGGAGAYGGLGGGHSIAGFRDEGVVIRLEDGSEWEIHRIHRVHAGKWSLGAAIRVIEADAAMGRFRHLLVNTDLGENANARYLGMR